MVKKWKYKLCIFYISCTYMHYIYTYTYNQYKFFFLAPQCSATDRWLKVLPGDLRLKQTHLSHMQRCKMFFFLVNLCYIALRYITLDCITFRPIASNFYAATIAIFGGNLTTLLVVALNHDQWKKMMITAITITKTITTTMSRSVPT